jgi:Holliday junction resolvase RusA-like endonuclease
MEDKQVIYGTIPSKSNGYRIIKIGTIYSLGKTTALKKYEKDFYIQANVYRDKNIEGYFEFYADVFYPNQRSDLDGCTKVLLDCLQKINAVKNDNRCTKIVLRKFVDKEKPRVEFILKEVDGF